MFMIDTGDTGGSKGPWVSWTSNGSAEKGFPPRSWVLREKEEGASQSKQTIIPAFAAGCVIDLDTLKLGWEKDGAKGMAPERRWNPSVSQSTPRPDDSKKASGAYAWSRALSVRMAIGGGKTATWEQGSFGAYDAFAALSKNIVAEWPTHSQNGLLLPLVKQTGVEKRELPSGSANVPVLKVERWVPRPDCLKADAPQIATGFDEKPPVQQQAPQPVQQQAAAAPAPVDAGHEF
jgi:hypothetical protein